jgi:hypothetical protein
MRYLLVFGVVFVTWWYFDYSQTIAECEAHGHLYETCVSAN